jgi:site-specific recombinase XerD
MDKVEIAAHWIRHSTVAHLLENGVSVCHVRKLVGHKRRETTVRYTQMQNEPAGRMYRKYHPQEHEYFKVVDGEYVRRIYSLLGSGKKV